jgi:hypothetical protein
MRQFKLPAGHPRNMSRAALALSLFAGVPAKDACAQQVTQLPAQTQSEAGTEDNANLPGLGPPKGLGSPLYGVSDPAASSFSKSAGLTFQGLQNPGSTAVPIAASATSDSGQLDYLQKGILGLPGYTYAGVAALPGSAAPGVLEDNILVKTAVSTGVAYDSNIFETKAHPVHDYIFFVSPSVDIVHDSSHSVQELFVSGTIAEYANSTADDYQDVYIGLRETYSLSPTDQVYAYGAYAYGEQRRVSQNFEIPSDAASPVPEEILLGSVGYSKEWGRIQAGASVTVSSESFANIQSVSGAIIDQKLRNEQDLFVNSYASVQITPFVTSVFWVQGLNSEFGLATLDYSEFRVVNTTNVAVTSKVDIGVLLGIREQDVYNNPAIHLGPLAEYELQANWRPTPLLSFRLIAGYHDLGVDYITGVFAGGFASYYSFDVSYWLRRNIGLQAGVAFEKRYLAGNVDIENILYYKAGLTYDFNTNVGISLLFSSQQWSSRLPIDTFNESIVESSLNFRF